MKSWPEAQLCQVGVGSKIAQNHSSNHANPKEVYLVITGPNLYEILINSVIIGQVESHSFGPLEVMSGHFSSQFKWKVDQKCN